MEIISNFLPTHLFRCTSECVKVRSKVREREREREKTMLGKTHARE